MRMRRRNAGMAGGATEFSNVAFGQADRSFAVIVGSVFRDLAAEGVGLSR